MALTNILLGSAISFGIAWMGWSKLERRAEQSASRSESFSLLTPAISLINNIKGLAEEQLEIPLLSELPDENLQEESAKHLKKRQAADIKFHTMYQLLRTKLSLLEERKICIPANLLAELRMAYTNGHIDNVRKFQIALSSADKIDTELYVAFERAYPKPDLSPWYRKISR